MEHTFVRLPDGSRALAYQVASLDVIDRRLSDGMDALSDSVLLEGRLARHADGRFEARYPVEGELLSERMERPFTAGEVSALFGRVAELIDALIAERMPLMNLRMALDEVAVDGATGKPRFVFLPLNDVVPDLMAAEGFFRSVGEGVRTADDTAADAVRSYLSFFQVSDVFDIMAFSKHVKQVVASLLCAEPAQAGGALPTVDPVAAPNDHATTYLGVERADDHGTTVLVNDVPDDHGTTVLGADESPVEPKNDFGTTVLGTEDDLFTSEHVIQSSQRLTGVLSDLDFRVWDESDDRVAIDAERKDAPEGERKEGAAGTAGAPADATTVLTEAEAGPAAWGGASITWEDVPADEADVPEAAPEPAVETEPAASAEPAGSEVPDDEAVPEEEPADEDAPVEGERVPTPEAPEPPGDIPQGGPLVLDAKDDPARTRTPVEEVPFEGAPAGLWSAPADPARVPADPAPRPVARCRFFMTRLRTGETFEVRGRRFVVGKSKHSSFQVRDTTTVSRSHAIFSVQGDVCTITDDDSRNGTFVNGQRPEAGGTMELEDGDTVRMSDVDFVFEVEPAR